MEMSCGVNWDVRVWEEASTEFRRGRERRLSAPRAWTVFDIAWGFIHDTPLGGERRDSNFEWRVRKRGQVKVWGWRRRLL